VRQRLDLGRADREIRIEQVREADAVRLGGQTQQTTVRVEGVCTPRVDSLEGRFFAAINETFSDTAIHAENQIQGISSESSDLNDLSHPLGIEAPQAGAWLNFFERNHSQSFGLAAAYDGDGLREASPFLSRRLCPGYRIPVSRKTSHPSVAGHMRWTFERRNKTASDDEGDHADRRDAGNRVCIEPQGLGRDASGAPLFSSDRPPLAPPIDRGEVIEPTGR